MGHKALFIVSKNGSLVYRRIFSEKISNQLSTNDLIRLSSTFHSMHAISSQIIPDCAKEEENHLLADPLLEGINEIVTSAFTLKSLQTNTGTKFILISSQAESIKQ